MDQVQTDQIGTPLGNARELLRRLQSGEVSVFPPPTPPAYYCSLAEEPALRRSLGLMVRMMDTEHQQG